MIFNINFSSWKNQLLLPRLRDKKLVSDFLDSLLSSVVSLHSRFLSFRQDTLFKLWYTGQVIYLERLLNAIFNNGHSAYTANSPTGIYISDGYWVANTFRWNEDEGNHDMFYFNVGETIIPPYQQQFTYNETEVINSLDFIVNVPTTLDYPVYDITDPVFAAAMRAWINLYRQAGSRYELVNYTP